jgi:hypothetical protein
MWFRDMENNGRGAGNICAVLQGDYLGRRVQLCKNKELVLSTPDTLLTSMSIRHDFID